MRERPFARVNPFLSDFLDSDVFVARVGEIIDTPELAGKLRAQAREDVVREYDLKSVCLPRQLQWVDELSKRPLRTARA